MSVNYTNLVLILTLTICMLVNLTFSLPFRLKDSSQVQVPDWSLAEENSSISKRNCAGFPCMYTHMAEKAGRASLYRALARIIDNCAADPRCNPGRRKRSVLRLLRK